MACAASPPRAIVVGAGIAGLSAAHRLTRAGWTVKVLEAADHAGGRMATERTGAFVLDGGAQFLSAGYPILLALIDEVGLTPALRRVPALNAVVHAGRICRLDARNPLSPLLAGLLGPREWLRLAWQSWRLRRPLAQLPLGDYSAWHELDDESAAAWADRCIGPAVSGALFEPLLEAYYFQSPAQTSRALLHLVSAFALRRHPVLTLEGGIARLPSALAAPLDLALHTPVRSVAPTGDTVSVWTDTARLAADFVILAVPAPLARQLHPGGDALERPLLATTCSAAINLAVMTAPHFRLPTVLRGVYGLAVPRAERRHLAAITIESHKDPRRAPHGGLFNLMLCGGSAATLLAAPDHTLLAAVLPEAERYLPGLRAALVGTRIFRWPHAEPRSPVGRARAVHAYRADCRRTPRRLLLAGDAFGAPFAEGAAESGRWAADTLVRATPT